jgi:hypothetical protein
VAASEWWGSAVGHRRPFATTGRPRGQSGSTRTLSRRRARTLRVAAIGRRRHPNRVRSRSSTCVAGGPQDQWGRPPPARRADPAHVPFGPSIADGSGGTMRSWRTLTTPTALRAFRDGLSGASSVRS